MESHFEPDREGKDPDEPGVPVVPGREDEEGDAQVGGDAQDVGGPEGQPGGDREEPVEPEHGGEMGG